MSADSAGSATSAGRSEGVRTLGGHSLIYAASSLMGQLGSLLTFPLYTRALGVETYGILALVLAASGVLRTLVISGTNTALIQERISADDQEAPKVNAAAFLWVGGAVVLLGTLMLAFRPALEVVAGMALSGSIVVAMILYIATDSAFELTTAVARALARPAEYAYANAVRVGITLLTSAFLLLGVKLGPEGAVLGMMTGSACAGLWLSFRLRMRFAVKGSVSWVPRLLKTGVPLLPVNLASWVTDLSDRYLLLALTASSATVGLYSAGYRVGSLITALFVGPFHTAFLPMMLRHAALPEEQGVYRESSRLFLAFGSAVVALLQAVAVPVVLLLAGPEYAGAERVVGPVALGCLLSGATMLMAPGAIKSGRSGTLALAYGIGAVVNVALNVALIPRMGMEAAALATLAGYTVVLTTMTLLTPARLRPPEGVKAFLRVTLIMSPCTLVSLVEMESQIAQAALGAVSALTGLAVLVGMGVLTSADLTLVFDAAKSLLTMTRARLGLAWASAWSGARRYRRPILRAPRALYLILMAMIRRATRGRIVPTSSCESSPYLRFLRSRPEDMGRAAADADRLVDGEMVTFGRQWRWGSGRDWHFDPFTGRRWAAWVPSGMVDVNEVKKDSDVQCPWETSRLEHVWRVALAYELTSDERYARWVVDRICEWRRWNRAGFGVNWTVSMEVAMRVTALVEIRSALCESAAWTGKVDRTVLGMIADHAEWVLANLERWGERTQNHYLVSLVGVIAVARHLPGWGKLAREMPWVYSALFECVEDQVLEDGFSFENSLGYHLLVCEVVGYAVDSCHELAVEVPAAVEVRLRSMVDVARLLQFADGSPVAFGDDDDDFLLPGAMAHFGRERAVLEHRLAFAAHATGSAGVSQVSPPLSLRATGIFIIGAESMRAFVNAMPTGVRGTGPHRHNDALSFCLEFGGRPLFVDPGTYRYQSDSSQRNRYRSVEMHNTVQIDRLEQNELTHLFAVEEDRIRIDGVETRFEDGHHHVAAVHHAYQDTAAVSHRRSWDYDVSKATLAVCDSFEGEGTHRFTSRLHMDTSAGPTTLATLAAGCWRFTCGGLSLTVEVTGATFSEARVVESWQSLRYREQSTASMLEIEWYGGVTSAATMTFVSADDSERVLG